MKVLVLNCGSSSLKYKLVDSTERRTLAAGTLERLGQERTHREAIQEVLQGMSDQRLDAVGHRVVHGGQRFHDPALITPEVAQAIEACVPLAPSHNPHNLAGIRAAQEQLPDTPQVAVFDTAFHSGLPRRAATYAIDGEVAKRLAIRRYGFHGTSHGFVAEEAARHLDRPVETLRLITLHLGNGASACAVEHGHSTETSMGLTPLEGLVMGSRCGDLDPGVVLTLLRQPGADVDSVERLLSKSSGLAGVSGISNDLRDLEARAQAGEDRARLSISVFAHRVRKYVGAYAAVMGGLDAVVLTGGIGENSAAMRRRILQRLEFLGLHLSVERNQAARVSDDDRVAEIHQDDSPVRLLVVATDEELRIAELTAQVAAGATRVTAAPEGAPVVVASRHVHLDAAALASLFGEGAQLERAGDLTQPELFLSDKTVDLVGPRNRIEKVPVVGPLFEQAQVEVSQTDEFHLGVDAPVRASGALKGSAPITLVGPKGSHHLREGLINPRRHLHLTPAEAEARGVHHGDSACVALRKGEREVVLHNVLVNVSEGARAELHIDTDEAAKAGLETEGAAVFSRAKEARAVLLSRRPTVRLNPR